MLHHINDIGFYSLAFLANVQPDLNDHPLCVMVGFFPLVTDSVLHRLGGLPREIYGVTLFESISASTISHEKTNNDF